MQLDLKWYTFWLWLWCTLTVCINIEFEMTEASANKIYNFIVKFTWIQLRNWYDIFPEFQQIGNIKKRTRIFIHFPKVPTSLLRLLYDNNNKMLVTLLIDWCHFRYFHTCSHQSDTFQNNIPPPPPPSLPSMPHHLSEDAIHLYTNQMTNHSTRVTFVRA